MLEKKKEIHGHYNKIVQIANNNYMVRLLNFGLCGHSVLELHFLWKYSVNFDQVVRFL